MLCSLDVPGNGAWTTWTGWGICNCSTDVHSRIRECNAASGTVCTGTPDVSDGHIETDTRSCTCPGKIVKSSFYGLFTPNERKSESNIASMWVLSISKIPLLWPQTNAKGVPCYQQVAPHNL